MAELDPLGPAFHMSAMRLRAFTTASAVCCQQVALRSHLPMLFAAAEATAAEASNPSGSVERSPLGPLLQALHATVGYPGRMAEQVVAREPEAVRRMAALLPLLATRSEIAGMLFQAAQVYGELVTSKAGIERSTPAICGSIENVARQVCLRAETEVHKIRSAPSPTRHIPSHASFFCLLFNAIFLKLPCNTTILSVVSSEYR
jgi:hypothetical protein